MAFSRRVVHLHLVLFHLALQNQAERGGELNVGLHPPVLLESRAGAEALPFSPGRDMELPRLRIIQGDWLGGSLGCLDCVLWVLAAGRVWYGGCRVRVDGHHGVSVSSEANSRTPGLSIVVFCFSWSPLLTFC